MYICRSTGTSQLFTGGEAGHRATESTRAGVDSIGLLTLSIVAVEVVSRLYKWSRRSAWRNRAWARSLSRDWLWNSRTRLTLRSRKVCRARFPSAQSQAVSKLGAPGAKIVALSTSFRTRARRSSPSDAARSLWIEERRVSEAADMAADIAHPGRAIAGPPAGPKGTPAPTHKLEGETQNSIAKLKQPKPKHLHFLFLVFSR